MIRNVMLMLTPLVPLVIGLLCAAVPAAQSAERYTLVNGKKNPLCQRFGEYLEKVTRKNDPPNCQTEFGVEYPEFAGMSWREVEPKEHPDLSVQAYRYLNYWPWDRPERGGLTNPRDILDGVELQHRHGWWRMWLAEVDIDNDGRRDKLLRIEDGRCGDRDRTSPRPYDWQVPVMILNEARTDIDTVKSELILGASVIPPFPPYYFKGIHGIRGEVYDVFLAGNTTYFQRWEDDWPIVVAKHYDHRYAGVTVYRIQRGKTEKVCRFKLKKLKN
jgi:hypothetical protein